MLAGGCFCGRIRYEVRGTPFNSTLCHCRDCRRATGAPMVAWFSCRPGELVLVAGRPKALLSSADVTRGFCADCGTALTYVRADLPNEIDVTAASLDEPGRLPPKDHTWHDRRLEWIDAIDGLPRYETSRGPGAEQI